MSAQPDPAHAEAPRRSTSLPPAPAHPEQAPPDHAASPASFAAPSHAAAPPPDPLHEEARVAAVLYDMHLRGGPRADVFSAQLSAAYPAAAALALRYAAYARQILAARIPPLVAAPPPQREARAHRATQRDTSRDFVLRRISPASVAWFCFFAGSSFASFRLCIVFTLALGATLAHSTNNALVYEVIESIARERLGEGPRAELYKWLLRLLTEQKNSVVEVGQTDEWLSSGFLPSYLSMALLFTPITAGIICFLLGGLATMSVNFALWLTGGIRFEHHED